MTLGCTLGGGLVMGPVALAGARSSVLGPSALAGRYTSIIRDFLEILVLVETCSDLRPLHGSVFSSLVRCRVCETVFNKGMLGFLALTWEVCLHCYTSKDV